MNSDIRAARSQFPATAAMAYFNTAAVGLASDRLVAAYRRCIDEWAVNGFDFAKGEAAAEHARQLVATLIGADPADVALIASVSSAAGLVAAQFGSAAEGANVVIGEREYSSNHFPWRLMSERGYDVRQVPFRNGGVEPDEVARAVDGGTVLVACSGVQTATGHRSDIAAIGAIARGVGALLFVDGAQLVGALSVAQDLDVIDILAVPDHKFLLNAGRGIGYCYLSRAAQRRFTPFNAGWKAGRIPFDSFFGPEMNLSPTASRFDNSISWLAAFGDEAALAMFEELTPDAIYARNRALADHLRAALDDCGWPPLHLPAQNRSTIVATPLGDRDANELLAKLRDRGVVCAARDGNLRASVHFYNDERDIERLARALAAV